MATAADTMLVLFFDGIVVTGVDVTLSITGHVDVQDEGKSMSGYNCKTELNQNKYD